MIKKIKNKKGYLLLEFVVVLMLISLLFISFNNISSRQTEETNKMAVAEHFDKILMTATKHFEEELCLKGIKQAIKNGDITANSNTMNPSTTVIDGVRTGVCGTGMTTLNDFLIDKTLFPEMNYITPYNILQQYYYGTIRKTTDNKPLLIIYSRHRNNATVDYSKERIKRFAPAVAGLIGSYAGYIPEDNAILGTNSNIAIGTGKGWQYNLLTAGINDGKNNIKPGNIIGIKILGERSVFVDIKDDHLLHRKDDPEDHMSKKDAIAAGLNAMEWNLNMSGNNIENVGNIQFSNNPSLDCSDTSKNPDGTVFYKNNRNDKNLYVCIDGKAHQINTSGNSYQIKDIVLTEANGKANTYITPPVCKNIDGTSVEPTAFISSTTMSSGENASPTATGDSIIAVKTWIEKISGKWRPRMEIKTVTGKTISPVGPHARILVMAICPRTN